MFIVGAYLTCATQWYRYDANPTVVSLEKDYRSWNGSLPAFTLCYENKLNVEKAAAFIEELDVLKNQYNGQF